MIFNIPLKACCGEVTGRLAGDECDCLQFAADAERVLGTAPISLRTHTAAAASAPSSKFPTPLVLELRSGLLRRVEGSAA